MTDEQPANVTTVNNQPVTYEPEDRDDTPMFTKKTESQLMKSMYSTMLQKMLEPDPLTQALNESMRTMAVDAIQSKFLGGGAPAKTSWFTDILNTAAAHGFGESLGSKLPEVMTALGSVFGPKKAGEIVDKATEAYSQAQQKQFEQVQEQQNNIILQMDANNPEHVKIYAKEFRLSEQAAKLIIPIKQQDILLQRQGQSQPSQPQQPQHPQQPLQSDAMMEKMQMMEDYIKQLESEKIEKSNKLIDETSSNKWSDEESEPGFTGKPIKSKDVSLFKSAIHVDVDDIKGNTDSFFSDKPKSELIEEKDAEGKSTFRMSDDPSRKVEVTTQKVKPIVESNIVEMEKKKEEVKTDVKEEETKSEESKEEIPIEEQPVEEQKETDVEGTDVEEAGKVTEVKEEPKKKLIIKKKWSK